MTKTNRKRVLSMIICFITFLWAMCGIMPVFQTVSAAQTEWKFDLGENAQSGYTSVSATQAYDSATGYGFRNTAGVKNVTSTGSGVHSDAVQFTDTENENNTFDVDLPIGLYEVTVTLGNTNRTSVHMEGMLQIVNMTGNNAVQTIKIPVTDGQLNIRATAGKAGYAFTISTIDIKQISTDPTMPKTIWMCGDSTVCNYYPLETSAQAGWGQVLSQYVSSETWQVRNMAASGQYAKGFVEAGQFDAIEYYGKAGDLYIISIGINDTNYSNGDEYTTYVTDMVKRAKAKGMQVVLVKQQGRASDVNRNPLLEGRWFGGQLDAIGAAENIQVIDLFTPWQADNVAMGYDETLNYYMTDDDLHPNRAGAQRLAQYAINLIEWSSDEKVETGAEIAENVTYTIKNKNSGYYLGVEKAENGGNVSQQSGSTVMQSNLWTVKKATDGYYYIVSQLDEKQYYLDLANGELTNGANIGIFTDTKADAQLFKFIANEDGSFVIATKLTNDKKCVEVKEASVDENANVQQWEINGHNCQSWFLEAITYSENGFDDVVIGDLNKDGKINVFDLLIAKTQVKNPTSRAFDRQRGDTDSDGEITSNDCKAISQYIVKEVVFEAVEKSSSFYYANEATYRNGVHESTNTGFKKDSYLNLDNVNDSFVEWQVYAPSDGNYYCSFSIANGTEQNRVMKIEVNGQKDYWKQDFLTTGGWTTWAVRDIVLPLKKGMNNIRMTSDTEQGGPNLDTLYIEKTDEPIAEVFIPEEKSDIPVTPVENPVVYIAGDSTVQTYRASYAPQQGWGAYLQDYLPADLTVSNHAIAGRSSKSFYDNGRLDTILETIKEGDYLLVQFGINDSAYNKEERYAPTCGKVPGDDGSFEYYIAKYVEGVKEKGANPVLVTTVLGLKAYNSSTGKFDGSYQNYCDAMKQLADYYNIPCIDLNTLMVNHYNSIGYDEAYKYHLCSATEGGTDMTHFTETGAAAVAKLVADALKQACNMQ